MAEMQDIEQEVGELEAVEESIENGQPQQVAEESSVLDDLEPRYKGKDVKDIIKMHQEAEKLIQRQSQEVGEIRKLADELIKSQLQPKPVVEEKPQEVDFFENPQEAIRRAVESNPKVLAAEQHAALMRMEIAKRQLVEKHPDFGTLVQDNEFV